MQTIWNRVAQVRGSCRCAQCVPSTTGVSRRAAASATRRMPRYLTSSTLWYSGIFAAAATFDAGFKQQRREKWDKAIAEVKQELAQPAVVKAEETVALNQTDDVGSVDDVVHFKPLAEEKEEELFQYADGWTKADWPANNGPPLKSLRLPPDSIYAEVWQRDNAAARIWTPKKLAMVQTAVDILLLEMFQELQKSNEAAVAAKFVPSEFEYTFMQEEKDLEAQTTAKHEHMRILRRADAGMTYYTLPEQETEQLPIPDGPSTICSYSQDDEGRFCSLQRQLNASIQHLFQLYSNDKINRASLLRKITYNLSNSSAPPNLNTFNTLLLGFSRAEEASLVRRVIGNFRRCHMRPNEVTLATVLNHFTKTDDSARFAYWIELIRGEHNGLALARPDIVITDAGRARLVPHPEHPDKILQLPYHTPIVFGAIIAGVVKFTGFNAALQICQSMGQEGWGLCMGGLTSLLQDCAQRGDWTSGIPVWEQIQLLKAKSRRKADSKWLSERIRLDTFAAMLRLCHKAGQKQMFGEVRRQALTSHRDAEDRLGLLVKSLNAAGDAVDESIVTAVKADRQQANVEFDFEHRIDLSHSDFAELDEVQEPSASRIGAEVQTVDAVSSERGSASLHQDTKGAQSDDQSRQSDSSHAFKGQLVLPERNETATSPPRPPPLEKADTAASTTSGRKPKLTHSFPPMQLQEAELHGLMPSSYELEDYEARERPMALRA